MDLQNQPVLVIPQPMMFYSGTTSQSYSAPITPALNVCSTIYNPNPVNQISNSFSNSIDQKSAFTTISTKAQIIAEIENEIQRLRLLESLLLTPSKFCLTTMALTKCLSAMSNSVPSLLPSSLPLQTPPNTLSPPSSFYSTPQLDLENGFSQPAVEPVQPSNSGKGSEPSTSADSDRPYKCPDCNKRFRFKSNVFEHKSLHASDQPYQYICPFCSKTCRLKGNLKKHLQTHMSTSEELEKVCFQCR